MALDNLFKPFSQADSSDRCARTRRPAYREPAPARPRVLIVDDDPVALLFTSSLLVARGFPCETVREGAEAVDRAIAFGAEIVLLDVHMAPVSGARVLASLRHDYRTMLTPVICVTADRDPVVLVALLGDGADDYVMKPFEVDELEARILVAARRRAVLGSVNPLTGLPGNVVLTSAIERRLADGGPFALLHIDIDCFKVYNDRFGFVRGDDAIATLARLISATAAEVGAPECLVAHIGGDDFAILTGTQHAEEIARALLAGFDRIVPDLYDGGDLARGRRVSDRRADPRDQPRLSLSIGIATTDRRTFASAAAMADAAVDVKAAAKRAPGSAFRID